MKQFYQAQNANRSIGGVVFEPYEVFAGTILGVYATENPGEITTLDALAADKTSGVTKIDEATYDNLCKKKAPNLTEYGRSNHSALRQAETAIKGAGAVLVENPTPAEPEVTAGAPVESVDAAIVIEKAEPSPTVVEANKPKSKRK